MLDLYEELKSIIRELQRHSIEYALCGGLAMAVHAVARATVDIDLLIRREDLDRIRSIGEDLGYSASKKTMNFRDGTIQIHRLTKADPDSEDILILDLLLTTDTLKKVWDTRQTLEWEDGLLTTVSKQGLITLKSLRGSYRDLDDITTLEGPADGR